MTHKSTPPVARRAATLDAASAAHPDPVSPLAEVPLIPVRMLNEFAYCPRLAYLEWVQGEWAENLETLEGSFGHRNVNRTDRRPVREGASLAEPLAGLPDDADPTALPLSEADYESSIAAGRPSPADMPDRPAPAVVDPFALPPNAIPPAQVAVHDGSSPPPRTPTAGRKRTPVPSQDAIHARTIHLAAEREGLVAQLDLLELEENRATPVDYKRGTVPNTPRGAYEPELVQLCAQALILRENGFECPDGVLYFIASKRRVVVQFDEPLVARTRELVQSLRRTAAAGVLPPPLEDSPKCPRCSLVAICLPDEVNLLRTPCALPEPLAPTPADSGPPHPLSAAGPQHLAEDVGDALLDLFAGPPSPDTDPAPAHPTSDADSLRITVDSHRPVRRLLPELSAALPLYVQHQGAIIGKSGERITIRFNGEELTSLRLIDVSQVCTFGNVMLTAHAIREFTARGIPICHFSYGGWFHSLTTGFVHKNVELRIRQYQLAADKLMSVRIARQLISGKIRNCRTMLRRHLRDRESTILAQLAEYHRRVLRTETAETLLGLEGMAAKEYFAGFFSLLPGQPGFDPLGRNRRPPRDPVNAVLSFVYALLTKELTATLQSVGFDPHLGFYHAPRYGRPSLALDLMEEFRPLIGDSTVLMAFNNGEVDEGSFVRRAGAVAMTDAGRRAVIAAYERRLDQEVTHPLFGYRVSYRRILEIQARLLARHVLAELDEYPSFTTR